MSKRIIFIFVIFSVLFSSCINDMIEYFDSEDYPVRVVKSSELFEKYGSLSVSSYNKVVSFRLKCKLPSHYLPNDSDGEKMSKTRFYIVLFPDVDTHYGIKDSYLITGKNHVFSTDIQSIKNDKNFIVKIPLHDFFFVPNGKHKIYFKIIQKRFYHQFSNVEKDTSLVWAIAEAEIEVPKIYKTTLCTDSIILRDDDTFSPKGMDFSFRLGYPDIYWKLIYYANENEEDFPQVFRSAEATYAVLYPYSDTVSFLHYKTLNKINLSVWDRDDMSADDFIGGWDGKIDELMPEKGEEFKELEFDNITKFKVKVLNKSVLTN